MTKFYTFIIQAVINSGVLIFLLLAVKILPSSPFVAFMNLSQVANIWDYMKYITYFIPVAQMIAILEAWVLCISQWYLWRFIYDISKNLSSGGTGLMELPS